MRVLLAAPGSRGDFQPMLALALGLRAAGHEALLAARPLYAPDAAAFSVPFEPLGQDIDAFLRSQPAGAPGRTSPSGVQAFLEQEFLTHLERLPALSRGVDLVVGAGMSFAIRSAAESVGVPYLAVAYAPGVFLTGGRRSIAMPDVLLQTLRSFHARHGLPAVEELLAYAFAPERVLLAADAELVGPLDGVKLWTPPPGALLLEDPRPLSAEVEAFLAAGEPPVYVGFGSLSGSQPALTERLVHEVAAAVGCRVLYFTGKAVPPQREPFGRVLAIGHTAHGPLFARVRAVVHHGGAGTLAAAARAGVPQVVVPHAFDQPFWAERAHRLGIAPAPVPARGVDAHQLASALQQALTDGRLREQAQRLAATLNSRSGVDTAVAALTGRGVRQG
ncbi:glycosyltransferase [Corallococcus sp. 4LFB]|uniref:glycosyltransferase n=1 Tax=Corallococcus sp. 4LFB TaxID=3383249 RepID=UPI003974F6A9